MEVRDDAPVRHGLVAALEPPPDDGGCEPRDLPRRSRQPRRRVVDLGDDVGVARDTALVDRDLVVLKVVPELPAWRAAACRGAKATFELAAGEAAKRGVAPGVRLELGD